MRHGGPRGGTPSNTCKARTLLLLEPCYIHIYRQHGGVQSPPYLPSSLNVGGEAKESLPDGKTEGSAMTGFRFRLLILWLVKSSKSSF